MNELTTEELSLLHDLQNDYEGELLQIFPSEYAVAQKLIDKGYVTLDPDSDDYVWFVNLPEQHRKTSSSTAFEKWYSRNYSFYSHLSKLDMEECWKAAIAYTKEN
jgi:hypothetical protein